MNILIQRLLEAEDNERGITVDFQCNIATIRLELVPMDVTVVDNTVELYDSERGEQEKIIFNLNADMTYDGEIDEYRIEYMGGELIIAFI